MIISKTSFCTSCSVTVCCPGLALDALLGHNLLGAHAGLLIIPGVHVAAHDAFNLKLIIILGTYAVDFVPGA